MANHKSALKRARQNENRRLRNRATRTRVKNVVKDVLAAAQSAEEKSPDMLKTAQSIIDKAAKQGVIHKKNAARKISRLSKHFRSAAA